MRKHWNNMRSNLNVEEWQGIKASLDLDGRDIFKRSKIYLASIVALLDVVGEVKSYTQDGKTQFQFKTVREIFSNYISNCEVMSERTLWQNSRNFSVWYHISRWRCFWKRCLGTTVVRILGNNIHQQICLTSTEAKMV